MLILIEKINEVYCRVTGDDVAVRQLAEHFTFLVPGHQYNPKYRAGIWSGCIHLLNLRTGYLYLGLAKAAIDLAESLGFTVHIHPNLDPDKPINLAVIPQFVESLGLPFEPYDFQIKSLEETLKRKKLLIISATSSGKTLIMYLIIRFLGLKTLVIDPRKGLIKQLVKDFANYGYKQPIHVIMEGATTVIPKECLVTSATWQSLRKLPMSFFNQFDVVIGDEVHLFDASSLTGIMEKTTAVPYKIGVTGSLKESKTSTMQLEGLFGEQFQAISTREMIDRGISSNVEIIVIVFNHSKETQDQLPPHHSYQDEDKVIINCEKRNKYIVKMTEILEGNTLVMFRKVGKHGDVLNEMLSKGSKQCVYVHGGIDSDTREDVRQLLEDNDDIIALASSGTTSTGTSINNIQNMIQTNGIKSGVDVKQTLGRGLRKDGKENNLRFYDLADKLTRKQSKDPTGYSYKHLLARLEIYAEQQLPYKIIEVNL